jgi:hypothetical protein
VVEGLLESVIAGTTNLDSSGLPALSSQGSDSGLGAQAVVVLFTEKPRGFAEHRGDDDSTGSGTGTEKRDVTMLRGFSLFVRLSELFEQELDFFGTELVLLMGQHDTRQKQTDVLCDGLAAAGGEGQGRLSEPFEQLAGGEAADAMGAEEFFELRQRQRLSRKGMGGKSKQSPQPGLIGGRAEAEQSREASLEQLAETIGEAAEFVSQVVVGTRELAELHNERADGLNAAEASQVGPERASQDEGIEPVVLGTGDVVTVAEAVELFRIEGENDETVLDQHFHDGAVRDFDADGATLGRADVLSQPAEHFCQSITGMGYLEAVEDKTVGGGEAELVLPTGPINAEIEVERWLQSYTSSLGELSGHGYRRPCTGARGATSHGRLNRGGLAGAQLHPGRSRRSAPSALPASGPSPSTLPQSYKQSPCALQSRQ